MSTKPHVVVAVRCHFERHGWLHPHLAMWLISLAGEQCYKVSVHNVCGAPNAPAAANFAAEVFLTEYPNAEWLCMVDNDAVPDPNMLRILDTMPADADICGGISHMMQDHRLAVQQGWGGLERDTIFEPLNPLPPALYAVDRLGGCCVFYRRRVFEGMSKPYYSDELDPETRMIVVSDDIYFQRNAKRRGAKLYCDTRFTTSHCHTVDLASIAAMV